MSVVHHLRIPLKQNESKSDALTRAQKQLKISDEDLQKYQIHFIAYTPVEIKAMR